MRKSQRGIRLRTPARLAGKWTFCQTGGLNGCEDDPVGWLCTFRPKEIGLFSRANGLMREELPKGVPMAGTNISQRIVFV